MRSVALAWVVLAVVGCGAKLSSPPEQGDAASASSRAASSSASSGSTSSSASSRAGTSTTVGVTRASDAGSVTVPPQSLRVAAGGDDTCIVSSLGHVACWGANESGELGVGDFDNRWTPTWLPGLQGVTNLVLGASTACVRKVDGSVWCWGGNETDELGVSTGNCPNVGSECTAVPVLAPAVGAGPLTAGPSYECATLVASGGTSCWGRAPFVGATGYDVLSLGCGDTFVCARFDPASGQDPTRNVICSTSFPGNNAAGQLGTGPSGEWTTGPEPAPAPVVTGVPGGFVELAAGDGFTCGVGAAGALACWGDNTYGALGLGAEGENVTFPAVCPSNASFGEAITACAPQPTLVPGVPAIAHVAAFWTQACAITTSGAVYCWGSPSQTSPASGHACFESGSGCAPTPQLVPGVANATSVAVGNGHACAATAAGEVYCWGLDTHGQLGRGEGGSSFDATPHAVVLPPEP